MSFFWDLYNLQDKDTQRVIAGQYLGRNNYWLKPKKEKRKKKYG